MNLIFELTSLLTQTKFELIGPEKINMHFPQLNGFVDLILVCPDNYICFKDFWTFNNLSTNIINNYIIGSFQINSNSNKKFIFILLDKNTDNNPDNNPDNNLDKKTNLLNNNIVILRKNKLDKLLRDLSGLLYLNKIYFYDSDSDTIMLE